MKVTKYAHSCLLINFNEVYILTDPGKWNPTPNAQHLDAIIITHEHQDHCDIEQLKELITQNPDVRIITQKSVGAILSAENIPHELVENGEQIEVKGVRIKSYGTEHAIIYGTKSPCRNTGYLINEELFVPGDALHDIPSKAVRVLALPCGGPWMKLSEAVDYAKQIGPKIVFPIHDAVYAEEYRSELVPRIVGGNLESSGIEFIDLPPGATKEF